MDKITVEELSIFLPYDLKFQILLNPNRPEVGTLKICGKSLARENAIHVGIYVSDTIIRDEIGRAHV